MGVLYAENGKIYSHEYIEIYIPKEYFDNNMAINHGSSVESLGIVYCRVFKDGKPGNIQLFNVPVMTEFMSYTTRYESIHVANKQIETLCLSYLPDTYIIHQSLPTGRTVAKIFLNNMLGGKLPNTIAYSKLIDIWWKNLQISEISYKVPSKIYEMIIAAIYRNPNNMKERYGQVYGASEDSSDYDYTTGNVREVVKNLSTFSGMVFEDMGAMISNGIVNSAKGAEEAKSPLEKIIYY